MSKTPKTQAGFTLTELMIVVVIVGILAAIGYPNYRNFVRDSKRADAHAALTQIAAQQERFFADNNTYSRNLTALGYTSATALSQEGYWQVSITATPAAGAATAFALSAAPAGNHTDPACATITLTSAGVKGSSLECW